MRRRVKTNWIFLFSQSSLLLLNSCVTILCIITYPHYLTESTYFVYHSNRLVQEQITALSNLNVLHATSGHLITKVIYVLATTFWLTVLCIGLVSGIL